MDTRKQQHSYSALPSSTSLVGSRQRQLPSVPLVSTRIPPYSEKRESWQPYWHNAKQPSLPSHSALFTILVAIRIENCFSPRPFPSLPSYKPLTPPQSPFTRLYSSNCSILTILNPHSLANPKQSSRRAMSPFGSSGLTSSQMTPTGGKPANLQRSVRRGKTCQFMLDRGRKGRRKRDRG
jgi:hypothetical protein